MRTAVITSDPSLVELALDHFSAFHKGAGDELVCFGVIDDPTAGVLESAVDGETVADRAELLRYRPLRAEDFVIRSDGRDFFPDRRSVATARMEGYLRHATDVVFVGPTHFPAECQLGVRLLAWATSHSAHARVAVRSLPTDFRQFRVAMGAFGNLVPDARQRVADRFQGHMSKPHVAFAELHERAIPAILTALVRREFRKHLDAHVARAAAGEGVPDFPAREFAHMVRGRLFVVPQIDEETSHETKLDKLLRYDGRHDLFEGMLELGLFEAESSQRRHTYSTLGQRVLDAIGIEKLFWHLLDVCRRSRDEPDTLLMEETLEALATMFRPSAPHVEALPVVAAAPRGWRRLFGLTRRDER